MAQGGTGEAMPSSTTGGQTTVRGASGAAPHHLACTLISCRTSAAVPHCLLVLNAFIARTAYMPNISLTSSGVSWHVVSQLRLSHLCT